MQQTAFKLVGASFILLIVFADIVFWIFGTSLLRAIENSLTTSLRSTDASLWNASVRASVTALTGPGSGRSGDLSDASSAYGSGRGRSAGGRGKRRPIKGRGGEASKMGRRHLYAAKRKVKWAMTICAQFSVQGYALLICSVFTKYGTAAPSVMFGVQMTILPLVWHVVNIQLHAGRSRLTLTGRAALLKQRAKVDHGDHNEDDGLEEQRCRRPSGIMGQRLLATCSAAFGGQSQPVVPVERDEGAAAVAAAGAGEDVGTSAMTPR